MKKFKTTKTHHKTIVIIISILILILFTILSFLKINKTYTKLLDILLYNFDNNNQLSLNILTSNLDNMISTYAFKDNNNHEKRKQLVYLYNTYNLEEYSDHTTISEATKLLKDNLVKLGIDVIQDEKEINNDVKYYLDIHRDSVSNTTVTINNKRYAKIMFVLDLNNKNYQENRKVLETMNNYLNKNYPGISRGIYKKKGSGVDGVYNEDTSNEIISIKLGGIENNREEINNSTEIIALMLYHLLGD